MQPAMTPGPIAGPASDFTARFRRSAPPAKPNTRVPASARFTSCSAVQYRQSARMTKKEITASTTDTAVAASARTAEPPISPWRTRVLKCATTSAASTAACIPSPKAEIGTRPIAANADELIRSQST